MPSRFENMFRQFAVPIMEREFGVLVSILSGASESAKFTARRNDREYKAIGAEYGIEISITMRDFVLPYKCVALDGERVDPRTGMRIQEADEVFEICPPDDNTPSVELQAGGFEWLVHTKRVE